MALPAFTDNDDGTLHDGVQAAVMAPGRAMARAATCGLPALEPASILVTRFAAACVVVRQTMTRPFSRSVAATVQRLCVAVASLALAACASLTDGVGPTPPTTDNASRVDVSTPPQVLAIPAPPQGAVESATAPDAVSAAASAPQAAAGEEPAAVTAPVDPLRPEVRVNLEDRSARLDLWMRVRRGFGVGNLNGDLVRKAERMYASQPDYMLRMTERGGRYLFHIVEEVQRRNLPTELALLPFVESAFNPEALSHASASGMWQFMPATGRVFNLKQNVFRDDRRDVLASTRAALDYLVKLHGMFGDWHLALAAYNWGQGSVRRAIKRNQALGRPTDYQSLKMPNETRFYIPKLQAIKNIVDKPSAFGLVLPTLENHPYFLTVGIERDMDVALAAHLANLPIAEFTALNPQLNRAVILAAGTTQLLMPYDNANHFVKAMQRHQGPLASWTTWTVPQSMKSADAARQAGMPEATFLAINHIPPRMIVQAGSTVLVPRSATKLTDVSEQLADSASLALAHESPALRKMRFRVGKAGDSVEAIAKRYRVTPLQVAAWNKVSPTARFAAGSAVEVHVATKTKRAVAARGAQVAKVRSVRVKTKSTRVAEGQSVAPLRR